MTKRKQHNGPRPIETPAFSGATPPENVRAEERMGTLTSASQAATPPRQDSDMAAPRHDRDRIASRAYELYLERGGDHGRDQEDWLRAEREISNGDRGDRGE